jgi:hypothetical protein
MPPANAHVLTFNLVLLQVVLNLLRHPSLTDPTLSEELSPLTPMRL